MTEANERHDDTLTRSLDELKAIGRELGGRIKDASEDVKEAWEKLQPRIARADQIATEKTEEMGGEVQEAAASVIDDLKGQLQRLRNKIGPR